MSSCLIDGRAPLGQLKACSTEKLHPQTQCVGNLDGFHPYLRHIASRKELLWRVKLWSAMGSATTQIEVLFCSLIPWLELASLVILPSSCWQSLAVIFYFVA